MSFEYFHGDICIGFLSSWKSASACYIVLVIYQASDTHCWVFSYFICRSCVLVCWVSFGGRKDSCYTHLCLACHCFLSYFCLCLLSILCIYFMIAMNALPSFVWAYWTQYQFSWRDTKIIPLPITLTYIFPYFIYLYFG